MNVFKAKIFVTLKPSILDPQGRTVERSLHTLGHAGVANVRVGKFVQLDLEARGVITREAVKPLRWHRGAA